MEHIQATFEAMEELTYLEKNLQGFKGAENFSIDAGWYSCPVESSIARQIGYKYFNEEIDKVKKKLKALGVEV